MELLITEVTEMHGGNYCVAGWDIRAAKMVRPLPNGQNWTGNLLTAHGVVPGAIVYVQPNGQPHNGNYPHATEDTPVDVPTISLIKAGPTNWFGNNAPFTDPSIVAAFAGTLACNRVWNGTWQAVHVPVGTNVRSLIAIDIPRGSLTFSQPFGKLRAVVNDGQHTYDLAVTSVALKDAWRRGGVNAALAALPNTQRFHVRIGLARAFANNPMCYAMVNGVHG